MVNSKVACDLTQRSSAITIHPNGVRTKLPSVLQLPLNRHRFHSSRWKRNRGNFREAARGAPPRPRASCSLRVSYSLSNAQDRPPQTSATAVVGGECAALQRRQATRTGISRTLLSCGTWSNKMRTPPAQHSCRSRLRVQSLNCRISNLDVDTFRKPEKLTQRE